MSPHVAVVGGGIAGLVAAWDLVRAGCRVTLHEAGERFGGALASHRLGGVVLDSGADAYATRSAAVPQLLEELGLSGRIIEPQPTGAWLQLPDLAAPLPATGILGIPADPHADDVVAILGERAARRAAEDLHAPVDHWRGRADPTLGEVVEDRMGPAVLDRLVTPVVSGVYSARAEDLDMAAAVPGLFEAMLREGSLAAAVAAMRAAAPAGSAVNSLHGGLATLVTALEDELKGRGARLTAGDRVTELGPLLEASDHVVLAVDGPTASRLLEPVLEASVVEDSVLESVTGGQARRGPHPEPEHGVALVTLLLEAPGLDAHPRGSGMLVAPSVEGVGAKAMTHVSAKWSWVGQALGSGRHVVRLSYGRVTDEPGTGALGLGSEDEELLAAARHDVGRLFGLEALGSQVVEADVVRWANTLPQTGPGHARAVMRLRESLADQPVSLIGGWFAGTGLARIVADARRSTREVLETIGP